MSENISRVDEFQLKFYQQFFLQLSFCTFIYLIVCVRACVRVHVFMCVCVPAWHVTVRETSENNLQGWILSFHHLIAGTRLRSSGLFSKYLYPVVCLANPYWFLEIRRDVNLLTSHQENQIHSKLWKCSVMLRALKFTKFRRGLS